MKMKEIVFLSGKFSSMKAFAIELNSIFSNALWKSDDAR